MSFWRDPIGDVTKTTKRVIKEITGEAQRERTLGGIRESENRIAQDAQKSKKLLNSINAEIDKKLEAIAGDKSEMLKQALIIISVIIVLVVLLKIIF